MSEKKCSKCSEVKQLEGFYRNKRREDGRQGWCKECAKKYDKGRLEYSKAASRCFSHPSRPVATTSTMRCDECLTRFSERNRARSRPEARKTQDARRRARKARMPCGPFSLNRYERLSACYWCGLDLTIADITWDHYLPVASMDLGYWPTHDPSNVVCVCTVCQGQRRATNFLTWRPKNQLPTAPCLTDWRTVDSVNEIGRRHWVIEYGSEDAARAIIADVPARFPDRRKSEARRQVVACRLSPTSIGLPPLPSS